MGSYKSCQAGSYSSTDSSSSKSTAATIHSDRMAPKPLKSDWVTNSANQKHTSRSEAEAEVEVTYECREPHPRSSTSTYASTTYSTAELDEEPQPIEPASPHEGRYCVNERQEFYPLDAIPSTPSSFAPLFPSSRRLLIRHDDATIDGNMNLRVDTPVHLRDGSQRDVILFHLRMYDLFSRKFSFRRYCRDSGREVCNSARREVVPAHERRPALPTSWSNVFAGFRPGSAAGHCPPNGELKRQHSRFEAGGGHENDYDVREEVNKGMVEEDELEKEKEGLGALPILGETILLEFSNYAHVELRRKGPGSTKKYEFEYWSTKYQWRREVRKEGDLHEVSYFLVDTRTSKTIAHLVPDTLAPLEVVEEESKGGWVPPSSLWISDPEVYKTMPDVADVIVATGIIALVDDCIRRRWHHERRPSWILPAQHSLVKSLERMGPRRLIGQVLQRRGSA
ncbi:hypothetical protein N7536_006867 [Penicillium majusculum]|uniref:Uncharacterized protein n=1 Tax=Penicillium solitum TaxID=60172 RepID=A0A1V6QY76_9EURO|nr:uncharacterized protein PENSOL_c028G02948 [Penicillium solitum]KAJ5696455.1 hypothetical protein N7536_006867 [Penicillium majusculum]OQD94145.1 hypothetical protein PENSOL_c028G02948 [Penicillium solitum]